LAGGNAGLTVEAGPRRAKRYRLSAAAATAAAGASPTPTSCAPAATATSVAAAAGGGDSSGNSSGSGSSSSSALSGGGRDGSTGKGDSDGGADRGGSDGRSADGSSSDGRSTDDDGSDGSSTNGDGSDGSTTNGDGSDGGTDRGGSAFPPLDRGRSRWEANLATIPDLRRSPERLADPPAAVAAARSAVTWTPDERATFLALHWAHGKDWRRVAAGLPSKAVADVVRHYYDAKVLLGLGTRLVASAGDTPAERAATFARLAAVPLHEARGAVGPGWTRACVGGESRKRRGGAGVADRRPPVGGEGRAAPPPPPTDDGAPCCASDPRPERRCFMRKGELWEILYHIFRYPDEPDPPPDPPGARAFCIQLGPHFWVWYKCVRVPPGTISSPRAAAAGPRKPLFHTMAP